MTTPTDRLDSWKEIAAYLKRSVRTVRRWESTVGLPVHRLMHRSLGSVYAYKSELDTWQMSARRGAVKRPSAAGLVGQSVNSIAVLPFMGLIGEAEHDYFADGLTDQIIADLSRVHTLRVTSLTSSMALKGSNKDVRTIGRELGVGYVVEGSVRRDGSRLRVSIRIIDAGADDRVWSEQYDGNVEDVFAIQERIARTVVDALRLQLTPAEERRLGVRPIGNLRAYECYLQARQEAFRWRPDAIDHAVQLLRNGLAIVGEDPDLYATLGRVFLQYREAGLDLSERPLDEAEVCASKVFALAPGSPSGFQLRGWIKYSRGEIQQAVRDLKAALETERNNPDTLALLCNCYLISGKVAEARPLIEGLLVIDPLTPLTRCLPGFADFMEGNLAAAVEPYRQMFEMDPGNPMGRLFYVWILAANRRGKEAISIAETFPPAVRDTIAARITASMAHALAGNRAEALAALTPDLQKVANATDLFPRFLAYAFALAGADERAIDWLEIAVARGFINYPFLAQHDPFTRDFRNHPRFQRLLESVRAQWQTFEP